MNHLLIVEDDRALGEGVRLALQGPALEVKLCHCLGCIRPEFAGGKGRHQHLDRRYLPPD